MMFKVYLVTLNSFYIILFAAILPFTPLKSDFKKFKSFFKLDVTVKSLNILTSRLFQSIATGSILQLVIKAI